MSGFLAGAVVVFVVIGVGIVAAEITRLIQGTHRRAREREPLRYAYLNARLRGLSVGDIYWWLRVHFQHPERIEIDYLIFDRETKGKETIQ